MASSTPSKIAAEYAKSNRSSCKKCSKTIAVSTLRLGLVSRDPRGYDMTKWHHLHCFPLSSENQTSVDDIKGFPALKILDEVKDSVEQSKKRNLKVDPVSETGQEASKQDMLKKRNVETVLDIAFSVSDVKDKYKEASLQPKWKAFQTLIFLERDEGLRDSEKIAAFDFDGCLVKTSVKKVGPDAWSLMYPSIPDKLQSLYNDGFKLVVFTNESNIERWKNKRQVAVDSKIGRLNNFLKHVKVPMQVFIACGFDKSGGQQEDPFRKPKTGMWQIMEKQFNSGIQIDMNQSFYVGDAAGRPNDHSNADIAFAR
ncbi:Polynucleotide kinase 3 phosphatase, partial [Dillenia turbinata]